MSDVPGAWALLFVARALRQPGRDDYRIAKSLIGRGLCRLGLHRWRLATPRYFVCSRCGKSKGI
jgi:hypothetical protein